MNFKKGWGADRDRFVCLLSAMLVVSGGLILLNKLVSFLVVWGSQYPGLPAWVQAVGSIVGVGAAIHISSSQKRDQLALEAAAREVRIATLKALCRSLDSIIHETPVGSSIGPYVRRLRSLSASFEAIDLLTLPRPELVEPTARLQLSLGGYVKGFKPSWGDARSTTEMLADASKNVDMSSYFVSQDAKSHVGEIRWCLGELVTAIELEK